MQPEDVAKGDDVRCWILFHVQAISDRSRHLIPPSHLLDSELDSIVPDYYVGVNIFL